VRLPTSGEPSTIKSIVMPREGGHPVRRGISVNYSGLGVLGSPVKPGDDSCGCGYSEGWGYDIANNVCPSVSAPRVRLGAEADVFQQR
jgi:hypothetical protein